MQDLNKLNWKIERWMIDEHYLPGNQLIIYGFIYEYSGQKDIANYEILKQLFVKASYPEEDLQRDLANLEHKFLIEHKLDDFWRRTYTAVGKNN